MTTVPARTPRRAPPLVAAIPADRARPRRRRTATPPRLRLAAAVCAEVSPDGAGGEIGTARGRILQWIESRAGPLPPGLAAGPADAADRITRHRSGAALIQVIDRAANGESEPPRYFGVSLGVGASGRWTSWEVVTILFRAGNASHLRAALFVSPRPGRVHARILCLPEIVGALAEAPGLIDDGWRIRSTPWIIEDRESVEGLVHLIGDPNRTRPVFATGLAPGEANPESAPFDPRDLAHRTAGLAHVAVVTGPMTYALTDRVGRRFSVFGNATRTYRPGCVIGNEAPEHPMALADTVRRWRRGGPQEFQLFLTREAARASVRAQAPRTGLPLEWEAQSTSTGNGDLFRRALLDSGPGQGLHPLGAGVDTAPEGETKRDEAPLPATRAG